MADNEEIKNFRPAPAQNLFLCMSKAAQKIAEIEPNEEDLLLKVGGDAKVPIKVTYPDGVAELTIFDMGVHSAIVSLYHAGNQIITIAMICRTLCMSLRVRCHSEDLQSAVRASIDKMRSIYIYIDAQSQQKKHELPQRKFYDFMLDLTETIAQADNGRICECYEFRSEPVIYSYSRALKHFVVVPIAEVDTSARINSTVTAIVVRYALLRRVVVIKRTRKNYRVALESLYKECSPICESMEKLRSLTRSILSCWEESGFIGGYEIYKEYRTIKGFVVSLREQPKK